MRLAKIFSPLVARVPPASPGLRLAPRLTRGIGEGSFSLAAGGQTVLRALDEVGDAERDEQNDPECQKPGPPAVIQRRACLEALESDTGWVWKPGLLGSPRMRLCSVR
jgi:hypothetical protein